MKKSSILLGVCLLIVRSMVAQVLVQDAKSASSILYRGNAINFDPTKAQVSFAVNSYYNEDGEKKKAPFWGIQGAAKSQSGLAGIVNSGSLVPEGSFNVTGGFTFAKGENPNYQAALRKLSSLYTVRGVKNRDMAAELDEIQAAIDSRAESSTVINSALKDKIKKVFEEKGTNEIADAIKELADEEQGEAQKQELRNIEVELRRRLIDFQNAQSLTDKQVAKYRDQVIRSYWKERHLVYGLFGGIASSFSYLSNPIATGNLNGRFEKKKLEAVRYGMGYNYQRAGKTVIGISFVGQKADNFSDLTSAEYTVTNTTQINSTTATTSPVASTAITQKLEDKQTFTGYSGDYQTYRQTAINLDLVKFYSGFGNDKSVVAINYYGRVLLSNKTTVVPNTITLGTGAYFFQNNGTFLGGIYLEFPDITNQIEALKASPVFKPFYNRISFGIVTKFSISSIISYGL